MIVALILIVNVNKHVLRRNLPLRCEIYRNVLERYGPCCFWIRNLKERAYSRRVKLLHYLIGAPFIDFTVHTPFPSIVNGTPL